MSLYTPSSLHIPPFIISPVNPRPEDNNNKPKRKRK